MHVYSVRSWRIQQLYTLVRVGFPLSQTKTSHGLEFWPTSHVFLLCTTLYKFCYFVINSGSRNMYIAALEINSNSEHIPQLGRRDCSLSPIFFTTTFVFGTLSETSRTRSPTKMKFITLFTALAVAIPAALGLTVNTPYVTHSFCLFFSPLQ